MKLKLKTLSSIHIGGKEGNFLPMEYLIFRNKCYFINEDKLSKELYDRQLLDNFLTGIKPKRQRF
ncbi:hypothetical protein [Candidatus Kuenenia stuttgartiensis]|uniref:hypothetical protein n=1 Tax=Kuenenia stuttgartiensis TaxID=174633 RepID=UPI00146C2575|nr:hypothetical protein [Candidatus Kuenenia stuttgartiensis]